MVSGSSCASADEGEKKKERKKFLTYVQMWNGKNQKKPTLIEISQGIFYRVIWYMSFETVHGIEFARLDC